MKSIITTAALLAMLGTTFTACKKDKKEDPAPQQPAPPANQPELITTMKVTLHDTTTHTNTTYVFSDLDGPGGNPATFGNSGADSIINITANHVYEATILLLDQTKTPVDTISNEVEEEGAEHQVFYQVSNNLGTVTYNDTDVNDKPIGLLFTLTTTGTGTGNFSVILRHELNKNAAGVSAGNIANAGGSTDVEVIPIMNIY